MGKINWKSEKERQIEQSKREENQRMRERFKGKAFITLSAVEKGELLEQIAKDFGYL